MTRAKFSPIVYEALRDKGLSNRRIAELLGVNEASVRRALGPAPARPSDLEVAQALRIAEGIRRVGQELGWLK